MIKLKFILYGIVSAIFLQGCSEILEPVFLFNGKQNISMLDEQEEFKINIKSLTFKTAEKANKSPYLRRLILTGSGSKAKVLNEANLLKSNFPKSSENSEYQLGIGDKISFIQLAEFRTETPQWPSSSKKNEYLLGVGDELTFAQSNDNQDYLITNNNNKLLVPKREALTLTEGVIGSNGNILLFGLGNILAAGQTLDDVRTEVRNILIRNGQAPNFQLEISGFKSKKAFVTVNNNTSKTIYLNNLPISLKEVALSENLSKSNKNFALIKLTRNAREYRMTAKQLFNLSSPEVIIKDNDQIEIQIIVEKSYEIEAIVGSKGNLLLPNLGSIPAVNKTIENIHEEISGRFLEKGMNPKFQLEIIGFASKKAYLLQKDKRSIIVPLTSSNITLRQLILGSGEFITSTAGLSVITLKRNGQIFRMTTDQVLDLRTPDIMVADEDQIEIENLAYKLGQVFALSGAGKAKMITIDPSKRETLADVLFTKDGALNNLLAKRSEIYLLRGKNPSVAYHLDAQNVSRILVAAKTELRPNDIVYAADRPIISFSRTLAEILPLRILLRDIENNNIP